MQGQLLSPLSLAFQACGYVLKELPGAGEDRGTWQLRPLFVLLPCLRVDLAHGQKQWCPLAMLMADSRMHLALSAPWSHHPVAATTLS